MSLTQALLMSPARMPAPAPVVNVHNAAVFATMLRGQTLAAASPAPATLVPAPLAPAPVAPVKGPMLSAGPAVALSHALPGGHGTLPQTSPSRLHKTALTSLAPISLAISDTAGAPGQYSLPVSVVVPIAAQGAPVLAASFGLAAAPAAIVMGVGDLAPQPVRAALPPLGDLVPGPSLIATSESRHRAAAATQAKMSSAAAMGGAENAVTLNFPPGGLLTPTEVPAGVRAGLLSADVPETDRPAAAGMGAVGQYAGQAALVPEVPRFGLAAVALPSTALPSNTVAPAQLAAAVPAPGAGLPVAAPASEPVAAALDATQKPAVAAASPDAGAAGRPTKLAGAFAPQALQARPDSLVSPGAAPAAALSGLARLPRVQSQPAFGRAAADDDTGPAGALPGLGAVPITEQVVPNAPQAVPNAPQGGPSALEAVTSPQLAGAPVTPVFMPVPNASGAASPAAVTTPVLLAAPSFAVSSSAPRQDSAVEVNAGSRADLVVNRGAHLGMDPVTAATPVSVPRPPGQAASHLTLPAGGVPATVPTAAAAAASDQAAADHAPVAHIAPDPDTIPGPYTATGAQTSVAAPFPVAGRVAETDVATVVAAAPSRSVQAPRAAVPHGSLPAAGPLVAELHVPGAALSAISPAVEAVTLINPIFAAAEARSAAPQAAIPGISHGDMASLASAAAASPQSGGTPLAQPSPLLAVVGSTSVAPGSDTIAASETIQAGVKSVAVPIVTGQASVQGDGETGGHDSIIAGTAAQGSAMAALPEGGLPSGLQVAPAALTHAVRSPASPAPSSPATAATNAALPIAVAPPDMPVPAAPAGNASQENGAAGTGAALAQTSAPPASHGKQAPVTDDTTVRRAASPALRPDALLPDALLASAGAPQSVQSSLSLSLPLSPNPGASHFGTTPAGQIAGAVANLQIGSDGSAQLIVQVNPAELGQVQVAIMRAPDGSSSVSVTAERPETLAALQTGMPGLNEALTRAGISEQRNITLHLAADATSVATAAQQEPVRAVSASAHQGSGDPYGGTGQGYSGGGGAGQGSSGQGSAGQGTPQQQFRAPEHQRAATHPAQQPGSSSSPTSINLTA